MLKKSYLFILCFFLLQITAVMGQSSIKKSTEIQVVNGKKYIIHKVEKGETLYAISRAYEVTGNDIVVENPETIDGLKPGQKIRIPVKEEVKKDMPFFFTSPSHVVKKGDTMYSLSKKYNISGDELLRLNPEIKDGLKLGMILRLPENAQGATPPPIKKDTVAVKAPVEKDTTDLKVAFLLPLYTSLNTDDKVYKDNNEKEIICPKSDIGVSFYEGASIAIDSMRKLGFSGKIFTYDSENDSMIVENILKKPELKEMDLIVGPLYASNFKRVSDYAKKNQIPLVSPFSQQNKILLGNPYIFKVTPSVTSQLEELCNFVLQNCQNKTLVLLMSDNPKDKVLSDQFTRKYYSQAPKDSIKIIWVKKSGLAGIENLTSSGKEVWALGLSNDQVFVTELVNKLSGMNLTGIRLFGLESWMGFESLDPEYLMKVKASLTVPQYPDYESEKVKAVVRAYREKFHTDPDKYALHAFDVTYYFMSNLHQFGRNFSETELPKKSGIQTSFNFVRSAIESGFENKSTNILEYKDYHLEKIN